MCATEVFELSNEVVLYLSVKTRGIRLHLQEEEEEERVAFV